MSRIYPNPPLPDSPIPSFCSCSSPDEKPTSLTVWRKSLLFDCSGFTVYDSKGNLAFRVDNYSSWIRTEIILMDPTGKPLFTIRRKMLSLRDEWEIYEGEETAMPCFSARKHVTLLRSKSQAHVTSCGRRGSGKTEAFYGVEGSFSQRSCVVYDCRRQPVVEIRRKEAVGGGVFGNDVFQLLVRPAIDAALAMAVVISLDRMFTSRSACFKG